MCRAVLVIIGLTLFLCATLVAAVPGGINYQGRLMTSWGVPVPDGTHSVRFAIYGASTGGNVLWDNGFRSITTTDGFFTYVLGSHIPLTTGLFTGSDRWLGITVGSDAEMTPRQRLVAAPYALQAATADQVSWSNIQGVPPDIADGDDTASVDGITEVVAGSGLIGGGAGGAVTLSIGTNGVNSGHIAPGSVGATEIAGNAIASNTQVMDNILTALDMRDEPGLGAAYHASMVLPDWGSSAINDAVLDSVTMTVPTPGFIMVSASGWFGLEHVQGDGISFARASVGTAGPGQPISFENFAYFDVPNAAGTGTYHDNFAILAMDAVGAGTFKYYLRGARDGNSACEIGDAHIQAIFVPTAYGNIEPTLAPAVAPNVEVDQMGRPVGGVRR